ncbi:unnamed protein product, partial [Echinostoma caproni]|uniref:Uncharacterized protein n=1 Tax=Echinostoma caproni TaxID=27848 RepID=A0A183BF84_9TREM
MKPVPSSRLDSQLIESTESPEESTTIGSEFNSANSLSDPIAGDHAAASILCGKVYGRFRRNQAAFGMDSEQANPFCPDSIRECLKQLEELASTGFQCCSAQEQDAILCKIHALINSSLSKSSTAECDDDWGRLCQILMGEVDASPGRHSNLPKRPRTGLKKSLTTPMFSQFLNNLTQFDTKNVSNGAGYSRWLTGLDPFLIRLATRPVNPLYQGNGLLCQIQHGILSSSSAYSDHPLLLWSPPKPPDLDGDCSSALFFSLWSPEFSSQEERLVGYVGIPAKLLSGSARLCELDAIYADTGSRANILTRWSDTSSTMDNVILFHVNSDESASPKSLPCAMTHMFRPLLPSRGSTMCFNPWLTDEWAVAGNHITSAGDRTAFIRLYTTDSTLPIWSGQVALDDPRETISGINQACCESAGSVNAADNVQTSLFTAFEPGTKTHPRFSVFTDGLRSAPFDHFLRIGYGSDPSQVCLTTSQRMLLMDTRQNSVAHCLFQFRSGDPALDSLFHSTDRFTAVGPRFLEDLYVLAGTAYNMLVLDKRMPTRPVLHWTHSLFGEPTYLNWTKPSGSLRTQYDLPELFVTTCSQNPPGVACVGLNLTGKAGCQLVGPTCSGAALTKVLTGAQNELPSQLMTNKVVNRRLQCTTFCGLTTNVMSHTKNDCHYL